MLRVIRTELYFNPLEIKWQFPELIISNPGISAAFFRCDPEGFDIGKVISRPIFDTTGAPSDLLQAHLRLQTRMRPQLVAAFLDTALQNGPFHWSEH
jgi:hypothetical protein